MSVAPQQLLSTAGIRVSPDACIVLVRTEWNAVTVDKLESGCSRVLDEQGVKKRTTLTVPGVFEIPFAIRAYWDAYKYKDNKPVAFIALGCVLKGGTPHFEYVCRAVTDGILHLNLSMPVPTIFGILTAETQEQLDERTGGIHGHKGEEAAYSAVKMISFTESLK
jgi:6,7-dimethyl-8-ribityllumazine synthase